MLKDFIRDHSKAVIIGLCGVAAVVALSICAVFINTVNNGGKAVIKYSDENRNATITIGEGSEEEESGVGEAGEEVEVNDIPTVEEVDAAGPVVDATTSDDLSIIDDGEEHGLGAYIYAPIETPSAFKEYTLGKCFNTDGAYGAQCWDLADVFWQNYVGRRAQTCGTGAAKGMIADGCWQKNAGTEFTMIWNVREIQAGDWVIFTNGQWGHVGMALGSYNNGYVTLLGQNQGGGWCDGGGAATNIINISLKNAAGAFRPNIYIKPEPTPEPEPQPEPENEIAYTVKKGDTLGQILRNFGFKGEKLFGDDGACQAVANENGIKDRGIIRVNQIIYLNTAILEEK